MTILKSLFLTLFLILVFSLTQTTFIIMYKIKLIPEYLKNHIGIINPISFIIAYSVLFKYFWETNLNIKGILNKVNNFKLLPYLPYLILIVFGLQFLNRPFWDLENIWNYHQFSELKTNYSFFRGFSPTFFYSFFSILIISPILEELFFRKFILVKLLERNNQKIGILISSLLFSIIHIETPFNLIPAFIFGVISSNIYINTKNIGYSILLHFLANLLNQVLYIYDLTFDRWTLPLNYNYLYWIIFLLGLGITFYGTKKILLINETSFLKKLNKK